MLSLDKILQPEDLKPRGVPCPEWGGHVYIATLRADQRDEFELVWQELKEAMGHEESQRGFRTYAVAATLCDESGKLLCAGTEAIAAAALLLAGKSGAVVNRLFSVACELNGLTKEDVEELEKNCGAAEQPPK